LTSTRPDKRSVYLEFPDFGYGPASTLLSLIRPVVHDYDWHVVSTGSAAAFALAQLPGATLHEMDTFSSHSWPHFAGVAPAGAPVVSVTNPGFAGWALRNGYRVGIVDTLDWMWDGHDLALSDAEFHLVQFYFGSAPPWAATGRDRVRPVVDAALWPAATPRDTVPGSAVLGFGGMHLPGADDIVAAYVRWVLGAVLPLLTGQSDITSITIAGGRPDLPSLVPEPWSTHPAVRVRTGLSQAEYAGIARTAEHLVCTPGLASIYECAAGGLTPLWQPGFNMSMVLQSRHLAATEYPYLASWPWLPEVAEHIAGLPEEEGVRYVAEHIMSTVRDADPSGECLAKPLARYVESAGTRSALIIPVDPSLPSGQELFAASLSRLA
jgi:hypothetical protein